MAAKLVGAWQRVTGFHKHRGGVSFVERYIESGQSTQKIRLGHGL